MRPLGELGSWAPPYGIASVRLQSLSSGGKAALWGCSVRWKSSPFMMRAASESLRRPDFGRCRCAGDPSLPPDVDHVDVAEARVWGLRARGEAQGETAVRTSVAELRP
mmetsp:Transcript_89518/g.276903  ORF Transcript_89518/g.276903 Transcript_89518/m.276903 type:complete len:108 (+) Transcript_89518:53-376(+)